MEKNIAFKNYHLHRKLKYEKFKKQINDCRYSRNKILSTQKPADS